jgi:hypothetical protein
MATLRQAWPWCVPAEAGLLSEMEIRLSCRAVDAYQHMHIMYGVAGRR